MTLPKLLFLILMIFCLIFTITLFVNIQTKRCKFIKNNLLMAFLCLIPAWTMAVVLLFLFGNNGNEIVAKVAAFITPLTCVCLVIMFHYFIKSRNIVHEYEQNNKEKDAKN